MPLMAQNGLLALNRRTPVGLDHVQDAEVLYTEILPRRRSSDHIVISPYTETNHLLDLRTLGPQTQCLALALQSLQVQREDYATAPYNEIFNWSEVIDLLGQIARERVAAWKEQKFYIVVFRSRIPPTTDYAHLGELDKAAHAEAMASGGFLKLGTNSGSWCMC
jgi:hypothetical protein